MSNAFWNVQQVAVTFLVLFFFSISFVQLQGGNNLPWLSRATLLWETEAPVKAFVQH